MPPAQDKFGLKAQTGELLPPVVEDAGGLVPVPARVDMDETNPAGGEVFEKGSHCHGVVKAPVNVHGNNRML
jgi:uncharacterized protein YfaP (DUF2135 family)